ncbi:MAG: response regulator transcription factor, partial [Tissierellales bacterium]|nr:response regulator transcription factor [Tissierellales bacterium]
MSQKILIVDDEPLLVKGLKYGLEQDGYTTEAAYDGKKAL